MLHIILAILKIIGWILLAILGLIVLLTCIVLFTPLRYEIKGKCDGTLRSLDCGIGFSYFLHLISGNVRYANEKLIWKMRIAWKRFSSEEETEEIKEEIADTVEKTGKEVGEEIADVNIVTGNAEKTENAETEKETDGIDMLETEKKTDCMDKGVSEKKIQNDRTDISEERGKDKKSESIQKNEFQQKNAEQKRTGRTETRKNVPKENLIDKLDRIFQKISCKFAAIYDKIKELIRKKDIVMEFLTNEIHTAAFTKAVSELKRLIRKLKPKKIRGNLEFGFEDPALTGKVLSGISILYPYLADHVEVNPRFEEKILKGDIYIKGRAAARSFAGMGIRLLLDKNIRTTIKHVRNCK